MSYGPRPGPHYIRVTQRIDEKWHYFAVGWNNEVGPVDHEAYDDEQKAVRGAQDWWPGYEVRVEYPLANGQGVETRVIGLAQHITLGEYLAPDL